ncbi:MAG TPA: VanZ family protein [Candidatus Krumholzibacteriaceae bacterium]|nr:VanZ family protein [Candidatus Krumholzibacteriaceae bacterium]
MKLLKCWFPLLIWILLIFGLSSIQNLSDEGIHLPYGSDKVIHYFEYSILALLFYRGLVYERWDINNMLYGFIVIIGSGGIALMDEFYQSFVPGRDASFFDLIADFLGIITGAAVYYIVKRNMMEKRKEL